MKRFLAATLAATMILGSVGCGQGDLTAILDEITFAVDVVVPFIPGIPAPIASLITAYAGAALAGVDATATELSSTDTNTEKAVKIAVIWAGVSAPNLSMLGLSPDVQKKIQSIVDLITRLLKNAMALKSVAAPGVTAHATAVGKPVITDAQRDKLLSHSAQVKQHLYEL